MPCRQSSSYGGASGSGKAGGGGYTTEAECLNACKEGACCNGTTCSVTPQCQCQGAGKVFKGVGTTCEAAGCDLGACCTGTSCAITTQANCSGADQVFRGAGTTCSAGQCCCPSGSQWVAVLYVACVDTTFSPCSLATSSVCGCENLSHTSQTTATTHATWVTATGRKGKACAITQKCGTFATESACKSYAAGVVGSSTGVPYFCSATGQFGTIPWGSSNVYDPAGTDGTGYKTLYDCVLCEPNPLP